jgi:hypothetical protein
MNGSRETSGFPSRYQIAASTRAVVRVSSDDEPDSPTRLPGVPSHPLLGKVFPGRDAQKRLTIVDGADRGNDGSPLLEIGPDGDGYKSIGIKRYCD